MVDFHAGINYVTHSDIEITEATADRCVGRVAVRPHHHPPSGVVPGGSASTPVGTRAWPGAALWAMERGLMGCVGVNNSSDFLRSVREGVLVGEATPIHRGRTQQLWDVSV